MSDMDLSARIERYVERFFERSGRTEFPNVRTVARALKVSQRKVEEAVDGAPSGNLQLTYYYTNWKVPLGDYYVETLNSPEPQKQPAQANHRSPFGPGVAPIRVVIQDPETGEELDSYTLQNDYALITHGTCHEANRQVWNGRRGRTHQLTIKWELADSPREETS